ncbi:hypothetical protein ASPTUDRAFT_27560 [Aspergillus tubingensis CBS 134.48]|uniref:Uncharacterized protein n=1 Tax=Aspergillus tubingensis (strain CBS 134.48) TaxID=767770 RepID=A0A1L9NB87_ASPTC|nr:hypothetical protein ASPTUDRAFT_27560 [Aspergillus tubingensis CBS 134.48]
MTPEENGRSEYERELVYSKPGSTVAPTPAAATATVGIAEVPPPSGPPSIGEWNMFDIFSFPIPHDNSQENVIPPLWTPDSAVPPMPSLTDYLQLPAHRLARLSTQPGVLEDRSASSGLLDSLRDIYQELSNVNSYYYQKIAFCTRINPNYNRRAR